MPELPEVETVRRVLEPQIQGQSILRVRLSRPEVISRPDAETFIARLTGRTVSGMGRRGKFLQIMVDSGDTVVIHLRMTGSLLLEPEAELPLKHTHVVLSFPNGQELRFTDPRRFGRIWLIPNGEPDTCTGIQKLGPEPWDPQLTGEYLKARCGKRKKAIKDCLLDQSIVAGIGNIYSDEILFRAGIRPDCPAMRLRDPDWDRLASIIPDCLAYYIDRNAVTPEEYRKDRGEDYRNTPYLQVYGHAGEPCPVCGTLLQRTVVCGRGSVFCPRCQKIP